MSGSTGAQSTAFGSAMATIILREPIRPEIRGKNKSGFGVLSCDLDPPPFIHPV